RVIRLDVRGYEPFVVGTGRQEVTDPEIARLEPLVPRNPRRRKERLFPRQQHGLTHRRAPAAGSPGHRDRPAPAAIAANGALEEVRDDPVAFGHYADVRTDPIVLDRRASLVHRRRADLVGLGRAASRRGAHHGSPSCLTCRLPYSRGRADHSTGATPNRSGAGRRRTTSPTDR